VLAATLVLTLPAQATAKSCGAVTLQPLALRASNSSVLDIRNAIEPSTTAFYVNAIRGRCSVAQELAFAVLKSPSADEAARLRGLGFRLVSSRRSERRRGLSTYR